MKKKRLLALLLASALAFPTVSVSAEDGLITTPPTEISAEEPTVTAEPVTEESVINEPVVDESIIEGYVADPPLWDSTTPTEENISNELALFADYSDPSIMLDSGTCGDNLTWEFDPETGTLTISGTGEMYDYQSNYSGLPSAVETGDTAAMPPISNTPWVSYNQDIHTVVIENGVTTIGKEAFRSCSLETVSLPSSVTTIKYHAFAMSNLVDVTIPEGVTTIEAIAFEGCSDLEKVRLPRSLTSIGSNAFYWCDSLTDIYYNGTEVDAQRINGWNNVVNTAAKIHYTTPNPSGTCGDNLTWEFNPATGTLAISGTGGMKNYSSRTAPWYAYADQITNLVVKENVLSIGKYALDGCSNLKTVSIPSTLTLIDQYAFNSASQMTDVYYNGTKSEWENISKKFGNTTLNGKIIHPIMAEGIGGNTNTDIEANASISYFGNFNGTFSPDSITAMKGTDAPRLIFAVDSYDDNDAADGSMFEFTVKLDNAKFIKNEKNPITVDDAISMFFITTSETNTTLASATNEFVPVGYDGWKPMTGGSNDLDSHDLLLNAEISDDHTQITYTIFAGKDAPIGNGSKFGVTLQSMLTETTPGTEASVTVIGDVCNGDELVYCQVLPDTYEIKSLNIKENAESSDYLDAIPATSFTAEIDVKTGTTSNTLILAGYDADNRMVFMKYQTVSSDNKTYLIDVENTDSSIKKLTAFFVSQEESKEPLTKNISVPA